METNMKKYLLFALLFVIIALQSCGYAITKKVTPKPQPVQIDLNRLLANPDKHKIYPQIPVIGYLYQNRLAIGDTLLVRRKDGIYHIFEYKSAVRIGRIPEIPVIEELEPTPENTDIK